jgi:hypothetical protein
VADWEQEEMGVVLDALGRGHSCGKDPVEGESKEMKVEKVMGEEKKRSSGVRNSKAKVMGGGIKRLVNRDNSGVQDPLIGIKWLSRKNNKKMLRNMSSPDGDAKKSSMKSKLRMNN